MTVNLWGSPGRRDAAARLQPLYARGRIRAGDRALKDFLGMFDHRMISLFYRAWAQVAGRGSVDGHRRDGSTERDWLTRYLLDVVGLGTAGPAGTAPFQTRRCCTIAGLLALPSRPAAALEQLVARLLRCRRAGRAVRRRVVSAGRVARRPHSAIDRRVKLRGEGCGSAARWPATRSGTSRAGCGFASAPSRDGSTIDFLPGGAAHEALRALTRFFGNDQFDFEVQLVLARDEAPQFRLDADDASAAARLVHLAAHRAARPRSGRRACSRCDPCH